MTFSGCALGHPRRDCVMLGDRGPGVGPKLETTARLRVAHRLASPVLSGAPSGGGGGRPFQLGSANGPGRDPRWLARGPAATGAELGHRSTAADWTASRASTDAGRELITYDLVDQPERQRRPRLVGPGAHRRIEFVAAPGGSGPPPTNDAIELLYIDSSHGRDETIAELRPGSPRWRPAHWSSSTTTRIRTTRGSARRRGAGAARRDAPEPCTVVTVAAAARYAPQPRHAGRRAARVQSLKNRRRHQIELLRPHGSRARNGDHPRLADRLRLGGDRGADGIRPAA